jgi:hypothetical protein
VKSFILGIIPGSVKPPLNIKNTAKIYKQERIIIIGKESKLLFIFINTYINNTNGIVYIRYE